MPDTVLITGANGFLATVIAEMARPEWRLAALVRGGSIPAGSARNPRYEAYFDSAEELPAGPDFAVVIHVAASIPRAGRASVPALVQANVELPARLITKYPSARHVLVSSVSVYGTPSSLPLSIESPTCPTTPYGWSKLAAEHLIRMTHDHAILRMSSIIGRGMPGGTFIPTAVAAAREGAIRLRGDGSRLQDYLHVRDAAMICIEAAARRDNFLALAVSGRACSNLEVARELAIATGASIECGGEDPSPSFSYTLERQVVLPSARVSLQEAIAEMVAQ